MIETLVMIMAGGKGERLHPLTRDRAKPAVPFGARYRIIDFVLSNFINSGYFRIKVLTQYRSNSLLIHLARGFNFGSLTEHYVDAIPAQQGGDYDWYQGTADAIFQNLGIIQDENPGNVAVFGGDHIYKMDIRQMSAFHHDKRADCTVACLPFDRQQAAGQFGIIEVDKDWRIIGFEEKPKNPKPIPGQPDKALVSMGNYIFKADALENALHADHQDSNSAHDFGKNVIPDNYGSYAFFAYNFLDNKVPGEDTRGSGYWRDVGTVDSYYEANMDLRAVSPLLNLYNYEWPIRSANLQYPPAKFVFDDEGWRGMAVDSIVANGTIVSGAKISNSVIFNNVFLHSCANVEDSILFTGCNIGRDVLLNKVICDKYVTIEDDTVIGEDPEEDARRFDVTPSGIVVIPKGAVVPRSGPIYFSTKLPPPGTLRPRQHLPGSVVISQEEAAH
ncbi:glucose-1-phosphate adenylyltransferase [bacterium]|nr:glucose-1-phosphate adenylyltransferase [bacterium]